MKLTTLGLNCNEVTNAKGDTFLFSYNTCVAAHIKGKYYRTSKPWSQTTSKHINRWLNGVSYREVDQSFLDDMK